MFSSLLSLWASVWMQPMLMLLRHTETRVHHSPGVRLILNWFSNYLLLIVAIAEKRLMDVKLGELGSWFGARDFTPNGIISAVRRGEGTRLQYSTNLCSILIFQYECVLSPPPPLLQATTDTTTSTLTWRREALVASQCCSSATWLWATCGNTTT